MFGLSWRHGGRIALVELNRPPANAIGLLQIEQLSTVLSEIEASHECRVVIFHSSGRFFSAGADIKLMAEHVDHREGAEAMAAMGAAMQAAFGRVEKLPVVTIAAITGICVGGGLELALACDMRVADGGASTGFPEMRIGLLPAAGGTQRLTRIAGPAVASRLILTGEIIPAGKAHGYGIFQELAEPGKALEKAMELAGMVSAAPRVTIEAIKRCLAVAPSQEGYEMESRETLALHRQPETKALIRAFFERSAKPARSAAG
ncbi:MAG: enoyl-CoA hydratase/isomerase family protein [Rhizobiaceae bacterium]